MQSVQDCMGDDVPEAVNRAPVRCILPERNMRTPPIIIGCPFRKLYPDVLMMQPGQDRNGDNDTRPLDCSVQRRIFL